MKLILFFAFLFAFFFILLFVILIVTSTVTSTVTFLTKDELSLLLTSDNDNYYKSFHANDFRVRNVSNVTEYLKVIHDSVRDGTSEQKNKITVCVELIKKNLTETIDGINLAVFLSLPWKIGFISGNKYENGYPHTRGDVIVLNEERTAMTVKRLCALLIHEQTHVYQKKFPEDMEKFFAMQKLRPSRRSLEAPSNPDLNQYQYEGYGAFYESTPNKFTDVQYIEGKSEKEHPLEEMAYNFENKYISKN